MIQFLIASSRFRTAAQRSDLRSLGDRPLVSHWSCFRSRSYLPLAQCFLHLPPLRADDPIYLPLIKQGLKVEDAKWISITAPTLPDGMKAEEQRKAIEVLTEGVGMEKFLKNSPVSPYVLKNAIGRETIEWFGSPENRCVVCRSWRSGTDHR